MLGRVLSSLRLASVSRLRWNSSFRHGAARNSRRLVTAALFSGISLYSLTSQAIHTESVSAMDSSSLKAALSSVAPSNDLEDSKGTDTEDLTARLTNLFSSFSAKSIPTLSFPAIPIPDFSITTADLQQKLEQLMADFPLEFESLRKAYSNIVDMLSMEEARRIIGELEGDLNNSYKNPEIKRAARVRVGPGLCEEEAIFRKRRLKIARRAFAKFIGVRDWEVMEEDVPVIGIAGSGGGYRAMVSTLGYLEGMQRSGILDCVTYMSGVSGSCWLMTLIYSPISQGPPEFNNGLFSRILSVISDFGLFNHLPPRPEEAREILVHVHEHLRAALKVNMFSIPRLFSLLTSSTETQMEVFRGLVQRRVQNEDVSLVDLFGTVIGSALFVKPAPIEDKNAQKIEKVQQGPLALPREYMKLSAQEDYLRDARLPLPIYCVVRHAAAEVVEQGVSKSAEEEEDEEDYYQWIEMTPWEVGCEEVDAYIPTWAFGRHFENGWSRDRVPEQNISILLGVFGSAFAATLAHYYREVSTLLPEAAVNYLDGMVKDYEQKMSRTHAISPANFPNPLYHLNSNDFASGKVSKAIQRLYSSDNLCLMDAGMDNNIPFYPLLRPERNVEVIIAIDSSADIQTVPYFDRAEGYVRRRGIEGWPTGAGWPKSGKVEDGVSNDGNDPDKPNKDESTKSNAKKAPDKNFDKSDSSKDDEDWVKKKYGLGHCTVFSSAATETDNKKRTYSTREPFTVIYLPMLPNPRYEKNPKLNPQTEVYCSTWNFVYTPEQVDELAGLGEKNWESSVETVRKELKAIWERKRKIRRGW